jgi:hypothetical protein
MSSLELDPIGLLAAAAEAGRRAGLRRARIGGLFMVPPEFDGLPAEELAWMENSLSAYNAVTEGKKCNS